MSYLKSGVTYLKRKIYTELALLAFEGKISEEIEKIPQRVIPDDQKPLRCCIFKDRAIVEKCLKIALGFTSEEYYRKDLAELAALAYEEKKFDDGFWLRPIKTACDTCPTHKYYITEACRNCVAHLCVYNCPKNAIQIINGRAFINESLCVECGKCAQVCPFHAIIELKRPCEYACPVGAIQVDKDKTTRIDIEKCILCGKCLIGCPFGAIAEKTYLVQVIKTLQEGKKVFALIAPSILGQFSPLADLNKINGALKLLGFSGVFDVAEGADDTAKEESKEFLERIKEKQEPFMTSSCCPSFTLCIEKHYPNLVPKVSHTPSPMIFTARRAKEKYPDSILVFIGPCLAKKEEARRTKLIDYVLTYEELAAMLVAKNIDVLSAPSEKFISQATKYGKIFPITSGVSESIKAGLKFWGENTEILKPVYINGINKETRKILKAANFGKVNGNFIEGMACEEGCIGGPHVLSKPTVTKKVIQNYVKNTYE